MKIMLLFYYIPSGVTECETGEGRPMVKGQKKSGEARGGECGLIKGWLLDID